MKKLLLLAVITTALIIFTQCRSAKNNGTAMQKSSYAADVQPLMADKCTPCHFPDKGGRADALNTYESVKSHIDDIVRRVQLNPGERGFMPMRKPKLSDSAINVLKKWKEDGLLQ